MAWMAGFEASRAPSVGIETEGESCESEFEEPYRRSGPKTGTERSVFLRQPQQVREGPREWRRELRRDVTVQECERSRGRVRIELAMLKTLVSAPMPIASVRVAQSTSQESRPGLRVHFRNCRSPARSPAKVDESALRICAKQGYLDAVADVQPVLAPHEAAFHGRIERPQEDAFGRDAGHDC
jgi:hypothetical protein